MSEAKLKLSSLYGQSCGKSPLSFYVGRIRFALEQHSFQQREQLLGMIVQAATGDRSLTVSDLLAVISRVEEAHKKSLEDNFNEQWKNS